MSLTGNVYKIDVTKLPWEAEQTEITNEEMIKDLEENGLSSEQESGAYYVVAASSEEALKKFESLDIETLEQTTIGNDDSDDDDVEEDHKEDVTTI